jgi:hypothetical protein
MLPLQMVAPACGAAAERVPLAAGVAAAALDLPELGGSAAARSWHACAIAASTAAAGGCLHVNQIHHVGTAHSVLRILKYRCACEEQQAWHILLMHSARLHAKSRRLLMLSCHGAAVALSAVQL